MVPSRILASTITAMLGGCAAFPSIVTMPPANRTAGESYDAKLADVSSYVGVFPVEVSGSQVIQQAGLYATWRKASTDLLLQRDLANNAQFGMTIAGAYDTARNSLRAAKWWLAGAAGLGLAEQRYLIEAQALQYSNGADAMECVRTELGAIPSSLLGVYVGGAFQGAVPTNVAKPGDAAKEAQDTLTDLFGIINLKMSAIAIRLRTNVDSQKLVVPTADEITKAVTQEKSQASGIEKKLGEFKAFHAAVTKVAYDDFAGYAPIVERARRSYFARKTLYDDAAQRLAKAQSQRNLQDLNLEVASLNLVTAQASPDEKARAAATAEQEMAMRQRQVAARNLERTMTEMSNIEDDYRKSESELRSVSMEQDRLHSVLDAQEKVSNVPDSAYSAALLLPSKLDTCATKTGK